VRPAQVRDAEPSDASGDGEPRGGHTTGRGAGLDEGHTAQAHRPDNVPHVLVIMEGESPAH
jgi:hypothetical protein